MSLLSGAEIIVRLLERQDVAIVAGIPGGSNLPLYDALGRSRTVRHVLARHEQGAGFIAQGIARATGRVGVCLATSGPGATNLLTAVADAKLDSVPLVCITGQVARALLGTDAFQEVDTYGMSVPVTKHNFLVRSAQELLEVIPEAFRLAASGRPGPVLVDVPKDVQAEHTDVERWPDPGDRDAPREIDPESVARAAALINAAARPVLYLGGGAASPAAAARCRSLAERADLPVTMTLMALGALPMNHPLSLGMLGMHAAPYTNHVLEESDLLIVLGARLDDRATGAIARFCPRAKVVHVDIDASELGKLRRPEVEVVGDLVAVLALLLPKIDAATRSTWRGRVAQLRAQHPWRLPAADDPRSPYGAILAVARLVGEDALITADVGQHQMRVAQSFPFTKPRQWLTSGGLGTMGFGLPAALGAALAFPSRNVICFSGDGSLLMNLQEMATVAEEGARVKVVLFDNQSLGLVGQQQDLFYSRRFACDYRCATDFPAIARAFGWNASDLTDAGDPLAMLADVLAAPGPALVRVPIQANEHVFPMVAPGGANTDMILEVADASGE